MQLEIQRKLLSTSKEAAKNNQPSQRLTTTGEAVSLSLLFPDPPELVSCCTINSDWGKGIYTVGANLSLPSKMVRLSFVLSPPNS
jgi:hypothetical protein